MKRSIHELGLCCRMVVAVHHSKCLVSAKLQAVVGGCFTDCDDERLGFVIAPTACHLN